MALEDYGIDLGKKLSKEDRQFLLDRNYWREVEANDSEHGVEAEEPESPFVNPTTETPEVIDSNLQGDGTGQESQPEQVDGDDVTKEDLKAILDARGVEYRSDAKKDELLALVNEPVESGEDNEEDDTEGDSGE